jgi:hypothetical protein
MKIVHTVHMPGGFLPLHCMLRPEQVQGVMIEASYWRLTCTVEGRQQEYLMDLAAIERADFLSVDQVCAGTVLLLGYVPADRAVLLPLGVTPEWEAAMRINQELIYEIYRAHVFKEESASVARLFRADPFNEAEGAIRELLGLAEAHGVRDLFGPEVMQRRSILGMRDALWHIAARLENETFRSHIIARGVPAAKLDGFADRAKKLIGAYWSHLQHDARSEDHTAQLRAGKAALYGDATWVSQLARTSMREGRWEVYQLSHLFDLRRAPAKKETPEPGPQPGQPAAGATPRPAVPAPVPAHPTPVAPQPAAPATPAGTAPPQPGTATPPAVPAAASPPPVTAPRPAHLPPPGTRVTAVVQPDGTLAWAPEQPAAPPPESGTPRGRRGRR